MLLAIILLITGIAVIILEFFIPSFGLIGIIGGASIIGSIVLAFRVSSIAGAIFLTAALIIVPVLMLAFFRLFPKTFFGKKLILHQSFEKETGYSASAADYTEIEGRTGTVITDLRPSGTIMIDEQKYSAVTSGEYITRGKSIIVKKTEGNKIIVAEEDK